jgi:hypothetical protein
MNEVQVLIDKCRKHGQATLRGVWPGRGKIPKEHRSLAKKGFGDEQVIKEDQMVMNAEGVEAQESVVIATIKYDKRQGVYQLVS